MPKTMNERFEERFPLQQLHDYHELTGHIARKGEIAEFIQSEIDLAVAEERKQIVEMIREYAEPYDGSKWLNEVNAQKIINLITDK